MNNDLKVEILKALNLIKENGPADIDLGICHAVKNYMFYSREEVVQALLEDAFSKWPGFSGRKDYPVTHPSMNPIAAYATEENLWVGEYGARRIDLLNFLIETLEGELV